MKKILMIILGVVVALFIIGFGVVKFYIEPNLDTILDDVDEGLSEAIQDYEDETYKETVEVNMADLMKEFEKDADEAEEKYIDKILVVTADLNKAEEFYAYE
ncbi:OB-fold protein, partial [Intestinibacter sp.]|uniref:OB-fold protein n=1 Tax=Intestinibacter sp. TaxID=1965304 RepID=UPI002A74BAAE